MIDFTTISFTSEEAAEIAQLEASQPDQAFYFKTHLALEKMGFIYPENFSEHSIGTITELEKRLVNKKGDKLVDLLNDWTASEYEDEVGEDKPGTFIKMTSSEYSNVTITFRKQSELATNKFSIHID